MAAPKRTRGFTLVELLVVITIIGMLVSLLLPAIQSAREAGRRNTCSNNMRNVGLALQQFESSKRYFPGYANFFTVNNNAGAQTLRVSWVVPILPYLERTDLYQNWQNPLAIVNAGLLQSASTPGGSGAQYISQLNILLCPSNAAPSFGTNPTNFVVNTGMAVTAMDTSTTTAAGAAVPSGWTYIKEDVNSGVFFNHCNWDGNQNGSSTTKGPGVGARTNVDFVSTNDGTTYTLMLSENLQAFNWATDPGVPADSTASQPFGSDAAVRQSAGMVWFLTGTFNNDGPPQVALTSGNFYVPSMSINDSAKGLPAGPAATSGSATNPMPAAYSAMTAATQVSGLSYARPSSNHPGGVNAMFVGGNVRFIAEDIPYHTYTQLMTSNQNAVNLNIQATSTSNAAPITPRNGATSGASPGSGTFGTPWTYTFNEADL